MSAQVTSRQDERMAGEPGQDLCPGFAADGSGERGAAMAAGCGCPKCGIYRWYPILLTLSTIMAGVFCWMYLSKPVFVSSPGKGSPSSAESELRNDAPLRVHDGPEAEDPPTAKSPQSLDPSWSHLPGEEVAPVGGMKNGASPLGVGDLEPVVVVREGPALFRPLLEVEAGGPAAKDVEVDAAGAVASASEGDGVVDPGTGGAGSEREGESGYAVRPSFMAEFSSLGGADRDKEGIAEMDPSNLR